LETKLILKRINLVIINRSFWPDNQILGEALLQLAELNVQNKLVAVLTQSNRNLKKFLMRKKRGHSVLVKNCKSLTNSSSSIFFRLLEIFYFSVWIIIYLIILRPRIVYVATDPPIIIPFIVSVYSRIFRAKYFFHIQDIHPEIANLVMPWNKVIIYFLRLLDNLTIKHASKIITLSDNMKLYLVKNRKALSHNIFLLDNPSLFIDNKQRYIKKTKDIIFCGNLGRLQRIPLLVESIDQYLKNGGKMKFTFIGSGLYSYLLEDLANSNTNVTYFGFLNAKRANIHISKHKYALLPIEDEVTLYAFPSKTSSYLMGGCSILSICSDQTSMAKWVVDNKIGINIKPNINDIIKIFFKLEKTELIIPKSKINLKRLGLKYFVLKLNNILNLKS